MPSDVSDMRGEESQAQSPLCQIQCPVNWISHVAYPLHYTDEVAKPRWMFSDLPTQVSGRTEQEDDQTVWF